MLNLTKIGAEYIDIKIDRVDTRVGGFVYFVYKVDSQQSLDCTVSSGSHSKCFAGVRSL
jgi:hypothetical protein